MTWKSWNAAKTPMPNDLIGTWEITILSGAIPNMRKLGHVKVIKPKGKSLKGYNRTLRFFRWGRFKIRFSKDGAWFLYGKIAFFDKVRKVNRRCLIGQYKLLDNTGKFDIAGYFQMRRKG